MNDLVVGQIVRVTAGRDKGDWMIVSEIIDDNYVHIVNGKNRKISCPKKKKVKHLAKTNQIEESISQRLSNGIKVSNAEYRKILNSFKENRIEKDEGE